MLIWGQGEVNTAIRLCLKQSEQFAKQGLSSVRDPLRVPTWQVHHPTHYTIYACPNPDAGKFIIIIFDLITILHYLVLLEMHGIAASSRAAVCG